MISRRSALRAGRRLNELADHFGERTVEGLRVSRLMTDLEAETAIKAVRVANQVMYQYFLIPRAIREEYFREELVLDGVRLQAPPEG